MKRYSKKQLNAISYSKHTKQRKLEEQWLINEGAYTDFWAQTKYKTMRGYINYLTNGKYNEVIK